MAMKEIEQKFLVKDDSYKTVASAKREIVQAYLSDDPRATVRVRISDGGAWLTVKGRNEGCVRDEWEYAVPLDDARQMVRLAVTPPVEKTRWLVPHGGYVWEVDEFHGTHEGLVIAEVEKDSEDAAAPLPDFVGREVTGDARYYNSSLARSGETPPSA